MLPENLLQIQCLWMLPENLLQIQCIQMLPEKAPPNPTEIIVLDEDMTIETDTDPNVLQKSFQKILLYCRAGKEQPQMTTKNLSMLT